MPDEKTFKEGEVEPGANDPSKDGAELPEEYKGKSSAELVAELQAAKEENAANTQRFGELQDEVLKLAKSRTEPVTTSGGGGEGEIDFFTKPKEAAEALFEEKMRPYKQAYMSSQDIRQMQDVMKLPYAEKYQKEIQAVLAKTDPNVRMVEGTAKAAYHYVLGQHVEDIAKDKSEQKGREPEFVETRTAGGRRSTAKPTLSDDERKIAEAGGQSEETFIAWRDNPDEMVEKTLNPPKEKTS